MKRVLSALLVLMLVLALLPASALAETPYTRAGAAVYLDAEGELLRQGVTAGPALIKPNQAELSGVMGRPLTTEDETIRAAQELLAQGVGCVAVTMGAGGALLCWTDCVLRCESPRVPVGRRGAGLRTAAAALA